MLTSMEMNNNTGKTCRVRSFSKKLNITARPCQLVESGSKPASVLFKRGKDDQPLQRLRPLLRLHWKPSNLCKHG